VEAPENPAGTFEQLPLDRPSERVAEHPNVVAAVAQLTLHAEYMASFWSPDPPLEEQVAGQTDATVDAGE
jgi:hypothetical protein